MPLEPSKATDAGDAQVEAVMQAARSIAESTLHAINRAAADIPATPKTYRAQWVLEEIIRILESKI